MTLSRLIRPRLFSLIFFTILCHKDSLWITFNLFSQKHGGFQFSCWKEKERRQCRSGFPWPQQRSQEAEQSRSFPQAASLRAPGSLHQCPGLTWWYTGGPQLGGLPHCGNMPGHHQVLPEAHLCPRPLNCAPCACKLYSSVMFLMYSYCSFTVLRCCDEKYWRNMLLKVCVSQFSGIRYTIQIA